MSSSDREICVITIVGTDEDVLNAFTIWSFWPGLGHLVMLGRPLQAIGWFCVTIIGYWLVVLPGLYLHYRCIRHGRRLLRERLAETPPAHNLSRLEKPAETSEQQIPDSLKKEE